jgi:hypothetical protein
MIDALVCEWWIVKSFGRGQGERHYDTSRVDYRGGPKMIDAFNALKR